MTHPAQVDPTARVSTALRRFPTTGVDVPLGETVVGAAVLVECLNKQTSRGTPMAMLTFRNQTGSATMPAWAEQLPALAGLSDCTPVALTATWTAGRDGTPEWKFHGATALPTDHPVAREAQPKAPVALRELGERAAAFLRVLSKDGGEVFDVLMNTPLAWQDGELESMRARFLLAPAAKSLHHATIHGLLFHSVQVVELALAAAETLRRTDAPGLDVDAVVLGAFWHDIGKLDELSWNGNFRYTARGAMSSHMGWGICRITEAVTRADTTTNWQPTARQRELIEHVLHIISSHHGQRDWGALVEPASREAWCVSTADQLSAKTQPITDAAGSGTPLAAGWTRVGSGAYARVQFISPTAPREPSPTPPADGVLRLVLPTTVQEAPDVS